MGPFNSDGASMILQAQAMLHGNPLLQGWRVADVSFYTTELPEYMLVTALRGLRPDVVHICGALTYTLTVLLAAFLARGRATGRAGAVRALLAVAIMLAPGITGGTEVFLENPDHAGTAVPILILLLLLDRARERWYVPAAVCLLLAWVQVADQLTLIAATAPVAAVAGVRLLVLAARRRPRGELRYDGLLLAAAVGSVVLASLAEAVLRALGGFRESPLVYGLLAPVSQIPANARMMGRTLLLLFGANDPDRGHGGTHQLLEISADIHLIGLALAAAGFAVAVILFFSARMDRVTQIVAAATAATLAAGIFGTVLPDLAHAHEVAILLPLGAVLAGRMLSLLPPLASVRWLAGALAAGPLAAGRRRSPSAGGSRSGWRRCASRPASPRRRRPTRDSPTGSSPTTTPTGWPATGSRTPSPSTAGARSWSRPLPRRRPGSGSGNRRPTGTRRATGGRTSSSRWPTRTRPASSPPRRRSGRSGSRPSQYQVDGYVVMVYDYNLLTRIS